jgi:cytoskeletal protein CcmA (bactofilin family)
LNTGGSEVELLAEAGETERVEDINNPLNGSSGRVYVTVHSNYYEAWGEFVAERTDGEVVELDHDDRTVTVELVVPSPPTVENAIYASSDGGNAATVDSGLVDSYDSSDPPPRYQPPNHAGSSGSVVTDGGISLEDTVRGNVYSVRQGGKISVDSGTVEGDVHGQRRVKLDGSEVTGSVYADENVTLDSSSVDGDIHTQDAVDLDTVDVDGDIYADDGLVLDDDDGAVDVAGEVHTDGSAVIDSATFGDTVYVEGNVTADEARFEEEVHVTGTLKQADESSFDDDVYVDGDVGKIAGSDGDPTDVEGSVHVTGDAEISELTITGDLHVGGKLICDGESEIQGDLYVDDAQTTSECPPSDGAPNPVAPDDSDAPDATETPEEPVVDPPAVELPPEEEFEELPDDCHANGNPDNEAIIIDDGRTCELDPGEYDVSQVSVDSGTLDISTEGAGKKVELYVGGDVSISESANVETGDSGHQNATEFEMNVYDEEASVSLSSNVTGVVNAPGTKVDIDDGANVFGAVIADKVQTDGGGGVHYDEALSGRTVGDGQGDVPTVRYLHVTTNEIEFER